MISEVSARDILAMIANDLRNPLTCIEGYAMTLQAETLSAADRAQALGRIISCTRWATALVSDLMDTIAIEKGKLDLHRRPIALESIIIETLEWFEPNRRAKSIDLSVHMSRDSMLVLADPFRLRQAIQNLLNNALKHVSQGGRIELSAYHFGEGMRIEVSDDGVGIEPADQSSIFEKFFHKGEPNRGSLGLGLYIAKAIVEGHNGSIGVRSEGRGLGSSFFLKLPAYDPEKEYRSFKAWKGMDTPLPISVPAHCQSSVSGRS